MGQTIICLTLSTVVLKIARHKIHLPGPGRGGLEDLGLSTDSMVRTTNRARHTPSSNAIRMDLLRVVAILRTLPYSSVLVALLSSQSATLTPP
jgi:hypothetical protein